MSRIIICSDCGEKKKHYAKGRCELCYSRNYWKNNRERQRMHKARYQKKNSEKVRAYNCRYYQEHSEEIKAQAKCWYQKNREKMLKCARRNKVIRRVRKRNVANTLTSEQTRFEREIGEATYPGEKLHLHHLVPISKGGGHTWGNIAFIPSSLNLSIQDKLPEEVYIQAELGI